MLGGMAVAEPYVAPPIVRRGFGAMTRRYFVGTTPSAYLAFGAMLMVVLVCVSASVVAPYSPTVPAGEAFSAPSSRFLLGTDEIGRDILSRVLIGMRSSLLGATIVIASGVFVGGGIGLIAGAAGGWVDAVLMRITDVFLALPGTILAVALVAAMGPSYGHSLFGVSIVWWPLYTRIVRAEVRKLRGSPHLEAARLAGAGRVRLTLRHLLPGAIPATIVTASLDVSALVLTLAGLSFLGLGAPAPAPELGAMTARGMSYIFEFWWIPIMPALGVFVIAVVANFGGDALRDRIRDR
jgi:peptide/nickel transport system permease protein